MGNLPKKPVAWATVDPVPESDRIWAALSALHPQTGLVPIRLNGLRVNTLFPAMGRACRDALRPLE